MWRSKISTSKTVYTIFNKGRQFNKLKIKLKYGNDFIEAEKNFKFLGLTLDPGLTLKKHAQVTAERASRRLNILKRLRGKNWGISPKLIITSYKTLIRPIIEYPPFAFLEMAKCNQNKLNTIQNQAIRIATQWPPKTSAKAMNQKVGLEPLSERAAKLTDKYICKSFVSNQLINETIERYKKSALLDDGSHSKSKPRTTILGKMKKNKNTKSSSFLQDCKT